MAALKKSEKVLVSLVLLSGCVFGEKMLTSSMQAESSNLTAQLSDVQQSIVAAKAQKDALATRSIASVAAFPPVDELEKAEVSSSKLSSFLKEITSEEEEPTFALTKIATDAPTASGTFQKMPVNIEVEATFPAVGRFLERLEDAPLLAEIDSVELARVDSDLRMVTAKIRLLTYSNGGAK